MTVRTNFVRQNPAYRLHDQTRPASYGEPTIGGRLSFLAMHQRHLTVVPAAVVALGILACTPRAISGPSRPIPEPQEQAGPVPGASKHLSLTPGSYRYRLNQRAEITIHDSGQIASPNIVTTTALFYVSVAQQADSSYSATVTVDSLSITAEGAIPRVGLAQARRLDSILRMDVSPAIITLQRQLPDSLCSYGYLMGTARLILLPQLGPGPDISLERAYSDTSRETTCRAGAQVESVVTTRLYRSTSQPIEFALEQSTTLHGAGLLRRDSVMVSGSVSTRGTAAFGSEGRLPVWILTNSEGTITVQIGPAKTGFRQITRQEIQLQMP